MTIKQLTLSDVSVAYRTEAEDMSPIGNYLATDDPEGDRATELELLERLESGDESAWCVICCTVTWTDRNGDEHSASDYLGGCSFEAGLDNRKLEAEIKELADGHGMPEQALSNLNSYLATTAEKYTAFLNAVNQSS